MWAFDGRAKHDNGFSFIGIFDIDENKNSSTSLSKKSHRHEQRIWNDSYIFTSLWDCYGSSMSGALKFRAIKQRKA